MLKSILILGFMLFSKNLLAEEKPGEEHFKMEISGEPKMKFFGLCVSEDGATQKKIEGVLPAEVQLDYKIQKCQVKGEASKQALGVRLFHNRKMLFEKKDIPPTAGIEFVIPLSRK